MITEAILEASCIRDAARLDTFIPAKRTPTIFYAGSGQSNERGSGSSNTSPIALMSGTAWSAPADQTYTALREMDGTSTGTSIDGIGPASSMYGFADYVQKAVGYNTICVMTAWQGIRWLKETPSSADWHHEVTDADAADSLVRSTKSQGVIQNRSLMIPRAGTWTNLRPDMKVTHRITSITHGEAEAPHLLSGLVTKAQYTAGYQRWWDWKKANEGFTLCGVHEHGRKGTTALEIALNEPMNILVREAQADFVNANADVIWASQAAKETGALTVDSEGVWTGGAEYDVDGIHWARTTQNAVGRLFAKRVIAHFGIS